MNNFNNPELKADKGLKGGHCNRTACQAPGAIHFHKYNRAYYCEWCARDIQQFASRVDRMELFPSMMERFPIVGDPRF